MTSCGFVGLNQLNRPRTQNHELRTKNHEPRTTNQEPRTKNHEPRTTNHELRTTNPEPNLFAIFASRLNDRKLNYMITRIGSFDCVRRSASDERYRHRPRVGSFGREQFRGRLSGGGILRCSCRSHQGPDAASRAGAFQPHSSSVRDQRRHLFERRERPPRLGDGAGEEGRVRGITISVAPREYVILRKLEYFKECHPDKHLSDVKNILKNAREPLDIPFIESYCEREGLADLWQSVKRVKKRTGKGKNATRKGKRIARKKSTSPTKRRTLRSKK